MKNMELQQDISYYLDRYGIKQSHVSDILKISGQQLSAWLHGKLVLPEYHIKKLADYLKVLQDIDKYLTDKGLYL